MKNISFIEEPDIIRNILVYLDLWETQCYLGDILYIYSL